jgi:hypothetical protein
MKVYVGVRDERGRWLRVASAAAARGDYPLCDEAVAESVEQMVFTILQDYLGDGERARALSGGVAALLGPRLRAAFWTLRDHELAAALGLN